MSFLVTSGLGRTYDGLVAVGAVDLAVPQGEIRAIIGPNGAGKTTLVGMICGRVVPSAGRIAFDGADITRLKPWQRVARGIVYTFQITSVFRNLSCFDNVALAAERHLTLQRGLLAALDGGALPAPVMAALARVGLAERSEEIAGNLSYGHQRLLEVAMGLALQPKLLILDEPTQGLSDSEIAGFCALIRAIAGATTILLIEHNVDVVMALAQRITVMDNGNILAEGSPTEIMGNPEVQRAYLGT
jgi:branched-chain amino acid transport system ATP-binding protein